MKKVIGYFAFILLSVLVSCDSDDDKLEEVGKLHSGFVSQIMTHPLKWNESYSDIEKYLENEPNIVVLSTDELPNCHVFEISDETGAIHATLIYRFENSRLASVSLRSTDLVGTNMSSIFDYLKLNPVSIDDEYYLKSELDNKTLWYFDDDRYNEVLTVVWTYL